MSDEGRPEQNHETVFVVVRYGADSSKPLRAFKSKSAADVWREKHVSQFDELGERDSFEYHIGMGAKATFRVREVPLETVGEKRD
ncbi:hypothetical protein [Halomarina oriensis]|nr:hypothetical protein [Halomarina oriensis]